MEPGSGTSRGDRTEPHSPSSVPQGNQGNRSHQGSRSNSPRSGQVITQQPEQQFSYHRVRPAIGERAARAQVRFNELRYGSRSSPERK